MKPFLIFTIFLATSAQSDAPGPDPKKMSNTWSGDPMCQATHPDYSFDKVRRWDGYTASDGTAYVCPVDESCVLMNWPKGKETEDLDIGTLYQKCTFQRCLPVAWYRKNCEHPVLLDESETQPPEEKPGIIDDLGRIRADPTGHFFRCAEKIDGINVQEWHSYRSYEGDKLLCPMSSECLKLLNEGPLHKLRKKFKSKGYQNHALSDEMCVIYEHCVLEQHLKSACKDQKKADIKIIPEPKR